MKTSMLRALAHVHPRHLLDRRLSPGPELRAAALAALGSDDATAAARVAAR